MIPRLLDVMLRVADALGVDPGLVDAVEFSVAPCAVVLDAWRHAVTVHESRQGLARERLLVRVKVCHDYAVLRARLHVAQTAAEAMKRMWGLVGVLSRLASLVSEMTAKLDYFSHIRH